MENKANEGSTQGNEGSTNSAEKVVDVSELQKTIAALQASNERLLKESKDYKEKYKSTATEVSKKEEQIALEKGDLQKLLEMERKKREEAAQENKAMREKILNQEIIRTVGKFATDVVDLEDLLNQPKFEHILKEGIDSENLVVKEEKAKAYVEEVIKAKPYLKKTASQPGVITKKPGNSATGPTSKPIAQMSREELIAAYKSGNFK